MGRIPKAFPSATALHSIVLISLAFLSHEACLVVELDQIEGYKVALQDPITGTSLERALTDVGIDSRIISDTIALFVSGVGYVYEYEDPSGIKQLLADPRFCEGRSYLESLCDCDSWQCLSDPGGCKCDRNACDQLWLAERACFTQNEMDSILFGEADWQGIGAYSGYGLWYAHGLGVPCCREETPTSGCGGWRGQILHPDFPASGPPKTCGPPPYIMRRDFALHRCQLASKERQVRTAVHEVGHVLNVHHSEYQQADKAPECADSNGEFITLESHSRFGCASRTHLQSDTGHPVLYVRPGPHGAPWCCVTYDHEAHFHEAYAEDVCSGASALTDQELVGRITVRVEPEKDGYLPGEPILVRVVIEPVADPKDPIVMRYPSEASLDARLGYLHISTGADPNSMVPVRQRIFGERDDLEMVPLRTPVSASGIYAGIMPGSEMQYDAVPFHVVASVAGLTVTPPPLPGSHALSPGDGSLTATSDPVNVASGAEFHPDSKTATALALFTDPESQRFLYLLGGDHLERGIENMKTIVEKYPDTIYAPYANFVLGMNLVEPFHGFVPSQGKVVYRPSDPVKAKDYLDEAARRAVDLPTTYRILLYRARGQALLKLGDAQAPTDRGLAESEYKSAIEDYQKVIDVVAPIPKPHSELERNAAAEAQGMIHRVEERLERTAGTAALRPTSP